jgi:hypothetical protein
LGEEYRSLSSSFFTRYLRFISVSSFSSRKLFLGANTATDVCYHTRRHNRV